MDTIAFIREQLQQARAFLETTMADVSADDAHARPPGKGNSIAATYGHLVTGEDGFVNGLLRGGSPLFAGAWAGKTGLSELPPPDADWGAWAARLSLDLDAVRPYARAVADETDAWLASLAPADLERDIDFSEAGFGHVTLAWTLGSGVLGHVTSHWGEICALKGLRGGKGFPL
ncbi:MAG: DinB family protein [Dehalococcoidia bacterium]